MLDLADANHLSLAGLLDLECALLPVGLLGLDVAHRLSPLPVGLSAQDVARGLLLDRLRRAWSGRESSAHDARPLRHPAGSSAQVS